MRYALAIILILVAIAMSFIAAERGHLPRNPLISADDERTEARSVTFAALIGALMAFAAGLLLGGE